MALRFWVAGDGNWDASTTTHWASSSGGAGGASVPGSGDTVILDGGSATGGTGTSAGGGAVISVTAAINVNTLTFSGGTGAFAGTLDFSAGSGLTHTIGSGGLSFTGTGSRKILLGSNTFNISGTYSLVTATNLDATSSFSSATLNFTGLTAGISFFSGGKTYGAINIAASAGNDVVQFEPGNPVGFTMGSLSATGPVDVVFNSGNTYTMTSGMTTVASAASPVVIRGNSVSGVKATLASGAVSNISWCLFENIAGSTSAINAANSLGVNTSGTLSITNPGGGGGSSVLGVIGG